MGFRTLVGGLYSDWLRPYIKSGLSCRDLVIDIISPEYLMSKIHRFFSLLKIDLWVIEGDEISSQKRLAIFYAGHELGKNYLTMLAFGSSYRENYIGKKWVWTVPEIVKKNGHKCSLMVIETLKSFRKMFGKTKCFYIPFWIFGETDVSRGYSSLLNKKNTSLKSDLSKIKRNNLHFELTNKPSMVHDFYYNMYIPYITKIHSNRSEMESYDFVKRELRKGGDLLFIKKEKEYIAGILLTYKNRTAKLNILGVKDGNSNYIKDGAIGAGERIFFE